MNIKMRNKKILRIIVLLYYILWGTVLVLLVGYILCLCFFFVAVKMAVDKGEIDF